MNDNYGNINIPSRNCISKALKFKAHAIAFFIILFLFLDFFFNYYFIKKKNSFFFEKNEVAIYDQIREKLKKSKCSIMYEYQREFLNGVIRKFRPKKILELGVFLGGSSIIILNAIKDIKNSHLYSIDINNDPKVGSCVEKYFPHLLNKWTLFKGNIAANYIEKIGNNIDLAFIDTEHFEPGEILDFLMILPFLKDEAIIIMHDIDHQITQPIGTDMRDEWAPYIIYNLIRGEKFLPAGKGVLNKDIGAIKLERKQKKYIHDYCRALGGQWQYFPLEEHIKIVINHFEKYYDNECKIILNETFKFNRNFVKNNPKKVDFYTRIKMNYAKKKLKI